MDNDVQGWQWPANARKAHFFVAAQSLCGRWMFFGQQEQQQTMTNEPGKNDCVVCFRKAKDDGLAVTS